MRGGAAQASASEVEGIRRDGVAAPWAMASVVTSAVAAWAVSGRSPVPGFTAKAGDAAAWIDRRRAVPAAMVEQVARMATRRGPDARLSGTRR